MSSWNRGGQNRDDKALREWSVILPLPDFTLPDTASWRVRRQKDEEYRIRKEEKEAAKRLKKDRERQARERDARAMPGSPYGAAYTNPMNDLERRMDNVDLSRGRGASVGEYNSKQRRTRAPRPPLLILVLSCPSGSSYQGPIAPPSPNMGATNLGYPPAQGGYPNAPYPSSGHGPDVYRAPSPFRGPAGGPEPQAILSRSRAPSPNPMGGPPGLYSPRSRAPSPLPGGMPFGNRSRAPSPNPGGAPGQYPQQPLSRSRAPSPLPGGAPAPPYNTQPGFAYPNTIPRSPHHGGGAPLGGPEPSRVLPPPDGFSRPANLAQSYTFFDTMKIQDMDDFYETMPRMPMVLVPHDVYHEDWIRFMTVRVSGLSCHHGWFRC
jgi:hypothetical protein